MCITIMGRKLKAGLKQKERKSLIAHGIKLVLIRHRLSLGTYGKPTGNQLKITQNIETK